MRLGGVTGNAENPQINVQVLFPSSQNPARMQMRRLDVEKFTFGDTTYSVDVHALNLDSQTATLAVRAYEPKQ